MVPASVSKVRETNDNIPPLAMLNSRLPQKMVHNNKMVMASGRAARALGHVLNPTERDVI